MPSKAVNVFVPPVGALTSMFFLSFMFFTPHNCVFEKSHSLTKEFSISFTSSALLASIYSIFAIFLFYYTSLIKYYQKLNQYINYSLNFLVTLYKSYEVHESGGQ